MCCGTIYVPPMRNKLAYSGCLKVSTAVVGLGAVAFTGTGGGAEGGSEGLFFSRLKLNATSLAGIAFPAVNFTPVRDGSGRGVAAVAHRRGGARQRVGGALG